MRNQDHTPGIAHSDPVRKIHDLAAAASDDSLRGVLIVDDDLCVRNAVARSLVNSGYEVDVADSAESALTLCRERRYAVILCDLSLPGLDGLSLLSRLVRHDPDTAVVMFTGAADAETAIKALSAGATDYLTKPVGPRSVNEAVRRALEKRSLAMQRRSFDRLIREEVAARTRELELEKAALRSMTVNIAETLVNAMEARDIYLRGHSHRVAGLAADIARCLGLPDSEVLEVETAGRLHDIGKIGIREEILRKSGALTQDELEHVQEHVRIGLEILSPLSHLGGSLRFIRDHHEHWDGTGYPRRLKGDEITLGGRILKAADSYDALTSQRSYREPMAQEDCLEYLNGESGRALEPAVFDALAEVLRGRNS